MCGGLVLKKKKNTVTESRLPSASSLVDARTVLAKGPDAYDGTNAPQPECICLVLDINGTQLLFETALVYFFLFFLDVAGKLGLGKIKKWRCVSQQFAILLRLTECRKKKKKKSAASLCVL